MNRFCFWATILLTVLSVPGLAWAQPMGDHPGSHMMRDGGWLGMLFGFLTMVAFIALIVAAVVLIIRWIGGSSPGAAPPPSAPPEKTPLDILKERYARGEIDKEEFEERRRVLKE